MLKNMKKSILPFLLIFMIIGKVFNLNNTIRIEVKSSPIEKIYVFNNNNNDEIINSFKDIGDKFVLNDITPILNIVILVLISLFLLKIIIEYFFIHLDKRKSIRLYLIYKYNGSKFKK